MLSFAAAATPPIITPVRDDDPTDPIDATEKADIIFLPPALFTALFSTYSVPSATTSSGRTLPADGIPNLTRYKYLAHVRNINTSAMSSMPGDADQGVYSVVVSHRTGPQAGLPRPAIVHLVSLQGIEANVQLPLDATVKRVAVVSLYSWNYTCLPPESVSFVDAVRVLGRELAGVEGGVRGPDAELPAQGTGVVRAEAGTGLATGPGSGIPAVSTPDMTTAEASTPDVTTATGTGTGSMVPAGTITTTAMTASASGTTTGGTTGTTTTTPAPNPTPTVIIPGADALLRPQQTTIARALTSTPTPVTTRLASRLTSGYSLVRYLTRSGDTTVAFFRGPLTPLPASPQPVFWPAAAAANFSSGLQILDPVCRVVDIAYASAWELGRTLAVADRVFAAAIGRVRRAVVVMGRAPARGKGDVLMGMGGAVAVVGGMVEALVQQGGAAVDPARRWMPPVVSATPGVDRVALMAAGAGAAMATIAAAAAGDTEEMVLLPYNEINIPASNDWALILKWVVDKLYLYNIPAHYLITDPSHLPSESIRFFYVDDSWLDALLDGALSVGNTLERDTDSVRLAMKEALNAYFNTPLDADAHPFRPQIPRYGFLLRSAIIKACPNMEVHAPYPTRGDPRSEVLRADKLGDEVLFCLFDRVPGDPEFTTIMLQQPPHQQRFAAGTGFETQGGVNKFSFEFLKMYTTTPQNDDAGSALRTVNWLETDTVQPCPFDYEMNTLIFPRFAETCISVLTAGLNPPLPQPQYFTDTVATSAVVGLQLNDGIARLTIKVPVAPSERRAELQKVRKIPVPEVPVPEVPPSTPPPVVVTAAVAVPATVTPPTRTFLSPAMMASTQASGVGPAAAAPPPPAPARTVALAPPQTTITAGPPGGQHASQFQITAFVIGQHLKPLLVPLYPDTPAAPPNLPIDIVFSFIPAFTQIAGLQIFRINIFIPLGPGAKNLTAEYNGPGGKMLSNQRFNVDVRTENGSLNVTLLPRSTSLLVPLQVNPDMSFVLNQVKLNGVEGDVRIDIREVYKSRRKDGNFDGSVGAGQITVKKRLGKV